MNILSLFDGISCGRVALERAGIKVDNYFASEIDKHAIKVSKDNHNDIIQLGDITKLNLNELPKIDLLMGGFPCQDFSFAGKGLNFEGERGKLFFELVKIKNILNPTYFLFENVNMIKEWQKIINDHIGCEPIFINSRLVSAQDRKRLYWTNIPFNELPEDKNVSWSDICEDGFFAGAMRGRRINEFGKRSDYNKEIKIKQYIESRLDNKTNCLTTVGKDNIASSERVGRTELTNVKWRYLTRNEMERLQTLPNIENNIIFLLCHESAKNYVSVVTQNPKLLKLVLDAEKSELNELVKYVWLNMNVSHQERKYIVHQNADMQIQSETSQCTNHNLQESNITVNNVANTVMYNYQKQGGVIVPQNVFISIIEGKITNCGMEELHLNANQSTIQKNGGKPLNMCGNEIMQIVEDVEKSLNTKKDNNSTSITSHHLSTKNLEQALIIYYLFAKNVITGYTQNTTPVKNLSLNFSIKHPYTKSVSLNQAGKLLGNGWTVDIIAHILKNII